MSIDPSTSGTLDFKQASKVTFVGSSSNTVIDTVTGSFGIGVDVNGPSSNLHVVGNTRLEGDINMLHTSNNAAIKLNSNVVTEFPRSKKLIKYPRVALTSASQDGYVVSASSALTANPTYWVFDEVATTFWHSQYPYFNTSNGLYSPGQTASGTGTPSVGSTLPTTELVSGYQGEWISIELPSKIKLDRLKVIGSTRLSTGIKQFPKDVVVAVSETGLSGSWSVLQTASLISRNFSNHSDTINITTQTSYYKYFALIVKSINSTATYSAVEIAGLELYGLPEYDPDADGMDVKVTSYPNVPNTDWLEVYYDAKNYTSGTITDESPNNYVGTLNNVTFDNNAIQSFDIPDGGNISATLSSIPSADFVHTVSLWLKFEGDTLTTSYPYPFFMGNNSAYSGVGLYIVGTTDPNILHVSCWTLDFPIQYTFSEESWYHVTYTYKGGGWGRRTVKAYVNGIEYGLGVNRSTGTEGTVPTLPTSNVPFRIGTTTTGGSFDGKIANIRLFNRALDSSEIYQLYTYQKEYFGHGNMGLTLKTGSLGIGTSEPQAALDVRGSGKFSARVTVTSGDDSITHYGPNETWSSYLAVGAAKNRTLPDNSEIAQCISTNGNLHLDAATGREIFLNFYNGTDVRFGSTVIHSSDDRLKSEEELIVSATDTLLKLSPQKYKKVYTLREDESREPYTESGLMAQDVWYDAPELRHLVHFGADANPTDTKPTPTVDGDIQQDPDYSSWGTEPAALNYDGLIAYLIRSNQELHARIQVLENISTEETPVEETPTE